MIRKFEAIKQLGVFPNYKWESGLDQFESFNLIYGWNGTGKSTLSRLLRYLEDNQYLPEDWEPKFKIATDDGIGTENNPDLLSGSICVFNTDFIEDNIQWKDGRTNKLLIGKASKELSEKLKVERKALKETKENKLKLQENLTKSQKERDSFLSKRASEIKKRLTTTGITDKYRNYNKKSFLDSILFVRSKSEGNSLFKISVEVEQKLNAEIQQPAKDEVSLIAIPSPIPKVLLDEATNILKNTPASSFIELLRKDSELNAWVKKGFDVHKERNEKECQFCLQTIPEDRFSELGKHFSDEYALFIAEIDRIGKSIKSHIEKYSNLLLVSAKDIDQEYQEEYAKAQQEFYKLKDGWKPALEDVLIELRNKRENPFEGIISAVSETILTYDQKVIDNLGCVNSVIVKHNEKSKNIGSFIADAKSKIEYSIVFKLLEEFSKLENDISSEEKNIEKEGKEISTLESSVEEMAKKAVDSKIGESEVNKDLHRFLGRDDIKLRDEEDGGYSIERNRKKAKYLSEGEKTAIALIYFFSKIREGKPLNEKTVVIDDPISSLDSQSTHYALSFIKDRIETAKQVFLFTHNFYCLKEVKRWHGNGQPYKKADFKSYMIECRLEGDPIIRFARITNLDPLLEKFDSEYHYLFSRLYNWNLLNNTAGTLEEMYPLANMARRVLETFLSFKVPHHSNSYEQMKHLNDIDETEKNRLVRFLDVMSHSDTPDRLNEFPPSSVEEMNNVVSSLINVIEKADKQHFKGMKSVFDAQNSSNQAKAEVRAA